MFPNVQSVYDKYKNNPNVCFSSANSIYKISDKDSGILRNAKKYGQHLPVLICEDENLLKALRVKLCPSALIFNKDGYVVFRGKMNDDEDKDRYAVK